MDSVHENKRAFSCSFCPATFNQRQNMKKHISSVHEGKRPYSCDFCGASLSSKWNLNSHISAVHEGNKPYTCDQCDYSTSYKQDLRRHIDSIHEQYSKCRFCDYRLVWCRSWNLRMAWGQESSLEAAGTLVVAASNPGSILHHPGGAGWS